MNSEDSTKVDFDVIVIGGGGAGLAAAIEAHQGGASCIVIEADSKLGGATALSAGVFYAAGTSVQRAAGISGDSADAMFQYVMTLNEWAVRPDLIRMICDRGAETIDWLIAKGVEFPPQWLVKGGLEDKPRGHPSRGAGGGIAENLINAAGGLGIEHALNTRVDHLLVENGRVVGIRAADTELRSHAVVIATGGYGNNPALVKRLFPTAAYHGERVFAVHYPAPYILGDGITMAEAIGASVTGIDSGLLNPSSGFGRYVEAFLPPWIMLVNEQGRRFMSEMAPYAVSGYLINEQTNKRAFAIFDEPTLVEASGNTKFSDPYNSGVSMPTWGEPMLREQALKGKVLTADTLEALAEKAGIDPLALVSTAERYSTDAEQGMDSMHFKPAPRHFPIRQPPFFAVEVRASIIGLTGGGLDIDNRARVLDTHGRAIPGLYACGETLGCIHGKRYAGGGMAIANAIIFGRVAGEQAAMASRQAH